MGTRENKSRARHGDFIGVERKVANSNAFKSLPPWVRALYVDLRRQHFGRNNGDISIADKGPLDHNGEPLGEAGLEQYGWAHSSVHKGVGILIAHGLIEQTRKGGIGAMSRTPSLFAFTDLHIVGNPKKGIQGRQASLSYMTFTPAGSGCPHCDPEVIEQQRARKRKKQCEGPRDALKGPPDGLSKVHPVTS